MNKGILLTLLFALPFTTHAGTKKCTGPDGAVFYTQTSCPAMTARSTPMKPGKETEYKREIKTYEIREYCASIFVEDPAANKVCYRDQVKAFNDIYRIKGTYPGASQQRKIDQCRKTSRPDYVKGLHCVVKALHL